MRSSITLFCFLLSLSFIHAQIIYTDVIPDQVYTVDGDTCHLDLNNDGTTDFYIRYHQQANNGCNCNGSPAMHPSWVRLDALGTNAVDTVINLDAPFAGAAELLPLTVIDASLNWMGSNDWVLANLSTYCSGICIPHNGDRGPWGEASADSPRFLGLRFESDANTYYGWARLSITHAVNMTVTSFTLKDYAYNSVPNEPILAGDMGDISTGVHGVNLSAATRFFPNPFSESTTFVLMPKVKDGSQLTLTDLFGREVLRVAITGAQTTVERGALASGFYFYRVVDGERTIAAGKIIVE